MGICKQYNFVYFKVRNFCNQKISWIGPTKELLYFVGIKFGLSNQSLDLTFADDDLKVLRELTLSKKTKKRKNAYISNL